MRLFDMVGCLSNAMDLVSPAVVGHHCRVGLIAAKLGEAAGLPGQAVADLALAGMIHDVGAFSLQDRLAALTFDSCDKCHAETGYLLLSRYPGLERAAGLVRVHHTPWNDGEAPKKSYAPDSELGNILCLADRVDVLLPRDPTEKFDREKVLARIRAGRGRLFNPWWLDAFETLVAQGGFLEEVLSATPGCGCLAVEDDFNPELSGVDISRIARLFSQIIDFRCRFTATHSRGVAATATFLGREIGLDGDSYAQLALAGELHDLGKLGVPSEIIMKPAPLDTQETAVMRLHAEHGSKALSGAPGMDRVAELVGQHHERLDGGGYPHGQDASSIGLPSRILAVSDVFTALGEDRPYRPGMQLGDIVVLLEGMADIMSLDPDVVSLLSARRGLADQVRRAAQAQALEDFEQFSSGFAGGLAPQG